MFSRQHESVLADLSTDLRDENDWKVGILKTFDFPLNVTALAIEPISRLLAAGTVDGAIHILGRPGVHCKISLPQPSEVRLLQFAISTFNIVCVDGNNQLHVYSLLEFGKPKLLASARYDQTNSMTLSPSHTHAFLATQNGDVKTYDLTCLRKSPYTIPNLWMLYEDKMAASGMPSLTLPTPSNAVEVVIHPRDLDHMFVAYAGGIILTDLTERNSIRAYELVLPPGAPGGTGYGAKDILTHRRMMVTSLTLHPSGHFFAAGYADGSIAFWAVEDDNKPLLVRTLDEVDVNIVKGEHLETHLSDPTKSRSYLKEPIFKLSWSSFSNSANPRGGDTTLTILGGVDPGKPPGLTVLLLPAFTPPEPPAIPPAPQNQLHPFFRNAMRDSLAPKKSFFYETQGLVQDYLLLPQSTPHLSGNFDPYAILIITELNHARTAEAYQYPPTGFIQTTSELPKVDSVKQEEAVEEVSATQDGLLSPPPPRPLPKSPRHLNYTPRPLRTPLPLSAGNAGILGGHLFRPEKDVYQGIIVQKPGPDLHLQLKGGQAYADPTNELKLLKYQPHRVLVTYNRDLSVRFFDISPQLLLPDPAANALLEKDWPEPLPALTIRLDDVFDDTAVTALLTVPVEQISIQSIQFAPEALECAVVLKSGEVLVYHEVANRSAPKTLVDTEIVSLDQIRSPPGSRIAPHFMLAPGKGVVETCALSDIGFLAVAYKDGSLLIIDMRGPRIVFLSGKSKKQRHSSAFIHLAAGAPSSSQGSTADVITSLTWTVSPLDKDPQLKVRLIVAHQSGYSEVYTLIPSGSPASWNLSGEPVECKAMSEPLPNGTFVLDKKTGAPWKADRTRFAASFKGGIAPVATASGGSAANQCFLLVVGAKGARTSANVTGDKVGKTEWGSRYGAVQAAQVVEHMGSRALVVQTDHHDALIYSLPYLEYICTLQIPTTSPLPMTIDDTGDFIAWTPNSQAQLGSGTIVQSATYGTLFDVRRAYTPPDIDFAATRGSVPAQPQPVSLGPASLLGSWFTYNQTLSGTQIDDLLGGPNRPIPEKVAQRDNSTSAEGGAPAGSGFAASAAAVQANLYSRLTSAMGERGQMLGDLEERFNSLEEGSRNMVAQAKRLATQQTAKSWFGL